MITSQNLNNKHSYEALFDRATQSLKDKYPGNDAYNDNFAITTLEEYFCCLKDLYDIDKKYIMLPLDEEPFKIDANSRLITVPTHFKNNGVSVVGDEIAETVFFRVDRFFDAMDLSSCDIFVQWMNKDEEEYATPITLIDLESDQNGGIIFAWPISSEMTKNAGIIRFSVRFLKRDDASGKIVYSFSTLTADIKINNALNFDIGNTTKDDVSNLFTAAIENSQSASGIPAAIPMFHINLPDSDSNPLTPELQYLTRQEGSNVRSLTLKAYADVFDTGTVRYAWYKRTGNTIGSQIGDNTEQDPAPAVLYQIETILEESGDSIPKQNKTYYTEEGELYDVTQGFDPDIKAYEKHNQLTISGEMILEDGSSETAIGEYYVKAINRFGNRESEAISNTVTLPGPQVPVIITDLHDTTITDPANGCELTIQCDIEDNGMATYTWQHKDPENVEVEIIESATENSYTATEPGYYQVLITNEVNLVESTIASSEVRVTNLPEAVIFTGDYAKDKTAIEVNINIDGNDKIDLSSVVNAPTIDNAFESDGIEYRWYIDKDGQGVLDGNELIDDEFVEITNDVTVPIIEDLAVLEADTKIRCVATNTLNGHIVRSESVRFNIIAKVVE